MREAPHEVTLAAESGGSTAGDVVDVVKADAADEDASKTRQWIGELRAYLAPAASTVRLIVKTALVCALAVVSLVVSASLVVIWLFLPQ